MREMSRMPGSFNLQNAAEHTILGSTGKAGTEMFAVQEKLLDTELTPAEQMDARRLALIPGALLPYIGNIPEELYQQVDEGRRHTFEEGMMAVFDVALTENRKLILPHVSFPPLQDRRTGQVENRYEVRAIIDDPERSENSASDGELDRLQLNQTYTEVFELLPREEGKDFRVLRIRID